MTTTRLRELIAAGRGADAHRLTGWEQDWLLSLEQLLDRRGRLARLTPPQADILAEIEAKMLHLGLIAATPASSADQPTLL